MIKRSELSDHCPELGGREANSSTGVETTDLKSLVEEIALIRVFTRRLAEACDPSADLYELAGILRILCLASVTITRILQVHYLISGDESSLDSDIEEAIRQVHAELTNKHALTTPSDPDKNSGASSCFNPSSSGEDN